MWPSWNQTAVAALIIGSLWLASRSMRRSGWERARAVAGEVALVLVLYTIWQYVRSISLSKSDHAFANGRWVWRIEQAWHLPSEATLQSWMVHSRFVTQVADLYYASVHGPALLAFLVWLWVRHRDAYPRIRNNLALVTGACLLIQLIPVAPPRMFPELGFIDTLHVFGPIDVYGPVGQGLSDQIGAMPSVHCAWALLVGIGIVTVSTSRWRWLFLAHPIITFLVVAATGNHWWLDGIVAGALLAAAALVQRAAAGTWSWAGVRVGDRLRRPALVTLPDPEPALVGASVAGPVEAGRGVTE